MVNVRDVIRRAADYAFLHNIDWEGLPRLVADAATVRGDPHVIREIIEDVITDVRNGKIKVEDVFADDTPSPLALYKIALERQTAQQLAVVRIQTRAEAALKKKLDRGTDRRRHKPSLR